MIPGGGSDRDLLVLIIVLVASAVVVAINTSAEDLSDSMEISINYVTVFSVTWTAYRLGKGND